MSLSLTQCTGESSRSIISVSVSYSGLSISKRLPPPCSTPSRVGLRSSSDLPSISSRERFSKVL